MIIYDNQNMNISTLMHFTSSKWIIQLLIVLKRPWMPRDIFTSALYKSSSIGSIWLRAPWTKNGFFTNPLPYRGVGAAELSVSPPMYAVAAIAKHALAAWFPQPPLSALCLTGSSPPHRGWSH